MKDYVAKLAAHHGVLERIRKLESDLLSIKHVVSIDLGLDCGFDDRICQAVILVGYDIPVTLPNYYGVRRRMLCEVINVAHSYGLHQSGDTIEDYGAHFYIVRNCDDSWRK